MTLPPRIKIGYDELNNPVPHVPDSPNYVAHESTRTLGEIFDICRTLPTEGKFVMLFFDKETNKFLQADESIFDIQIEFDHKRLCLYSGYHSDVRNMLNKDFLYSCDPNMTGKVFRVFNNWEIDEHTPLYVRTKRHGNHTINDVIEFECNGQSYVGFVSNATVN